MKTIKDISESFVEAVGTGRLVFWELDSDLRITYLSDNIKTIVGQESEFFINKKITEFITDKTEKNRVERFFKEKMLFEESFFDLDIPFTFFGKNVIFSLIGKPHKSENKKFKGVLLDITQCKQANLELKEHNNKYKTILEVFKDGVLELDYNQKIVFLNEKLASTLGYSYQEMIGKDIFNFIAEEEKENVIGKLENRKKGFQDIYSIKLLARDGSFCKFLVSAFPLFDENKNYRGSISYFEKIKKLDSSDDVDLFSYALEQANDGVCIVKDNKMQFSNAALCNLLGYSMEEIIGLDYNLFLSDDSCDVVKRMYLLRRQNKKVPSIYEATLKTKEGKLKNVEFSVRLFEYKQEQLVVVVIRDIVNRQEKAKNLNSLSHSISLNSKIDGFSEKNNFTHILNMLKAGHGCFIITDNLGNFVYVNADIASWIGYSLQQVEAFKTIKKFFSKVVIDKVDLSKDFINKEFSLRLTTKLGQERFFILKTKEIILDKQFIAYVFCDTTEQVLSRKRIESIQKDFVVFLFESHDVVFVFDENKKIRYFNKKAFEFIGKPEKSVVGKSVCDFLGCVFFNAYKKLIADCAVCKKCELMNRLDEVIKNKKIISNVNLELQVNFLDNKKDILKISSLFMPVTWNDTDLFLMSFHDSSLKQNFEEYSKEINLQLEAQKNVIERKNIVLKEIISMVEEEKNNVQKQVEHYITSSVLPIVEKIKNKADEKTKKQIGLLEKSLTDVFSGFSQKITFNDNNLSPREREICVMIRNGLSSKEIAASLNISLKSVEAHRYNIRKKLNIPNSKSFNLTSYLQSN